MANDMHSRAEVRLSESSGECACEHPACLKCRDQRSASKRNAPTLPPPAEDIGIALERLATAASAVSVASRSVSTADECASAARCISDTLRVLAGAMNALQVKALRLRHGIVEFDECPSTRRSK